MERRYQEHIATKEIKQLLEQLIDPSLPPQQYAMVMYKLGYAFGPLIEQQLKHPTAVTIACTVEDADHLAAGMIDYLEKKDNTVYLNVFWNKRFKPGGISVAPIVKQYRDKGSTHTHTLVILKSIISSSCVVRTNLTRLIEEFVPDQIFVAAPVLWKGSLQNLESEFDQAVSSRFQYLYFAEDEVRTTDGTIIPGIGGDIYQRLGFSGQDDKNRFIPQIVKDRRQHIGR